MHRNQRYLVALSGTEQDAALLNYARLLARSRLGREFRFVHVAHPQRRNTAKQQALSDAEMLAQLESEVAEHFGPASESVGMSCHLLHGERVDALIEFTTRSRSDVILLGHRQARSGQRSLARRLAMIAPASVWLVPEGAPISIRHVLSPVDFSEPSADSFEAATAIAQATVAERFTALHVFFDASSIRYPEHVQEVTQCEATGMKEFLARVKTHNVEVQVRLEEGSFPSRTILRIAQEEAVDLIVMNTRGRSRAAAILLGSVTTRVMTESPVAVLAIKHFGAAMGLFQALQDSHYWQKPLKSN